MAIDSVLNPVGIAQKLSVAQLQKAIQDGTVPAYVGIPLLQEKIAMEKRMRDAAARPEQGPAIAQRVMAEAQGLNQLPSNLPTEYAGGGIVAFAEGDLVDEEDEDQDYTDVLNEAMKSMEEARDRMSSMYSKDMENENSLEALPVSITGDGITQTETLKSFASKESGKPEKKVEHRTKSVTAPAGLESLIELVKQKESGGRRYDQYGNLLTSPKGAMGEMQVMPATAREPGFGIEPARAGDAEDIARVGREYFAKLKERYGDPKLAAIAYNWGPANTDKWLASGADMSRLPEETRRYVQGFASGGVAKFDGGGIADLFSMTPEEVKEYARRMMRIGDARAAFSSVPESVSAAPAVAETGAGGLWNAIKSGLGSLNPAGIAAWGLGTYHPELNVGEQDELERRRAMGPTIDTTAKLTPMIPPRTAGAGRGVQGGPTAEALRQADFERQIGLAQDTEDLEAGMYALEPEKKTEKPEEKKPEEAKESPTMKALRERIMAGYDKMEKQAESDRYLALLSAGLGIMGGKSPYAMANIGAGAQQGIEQYAKSEAARAAQEKALMTSQLGLERYAQADEIRRQQLALREQLANAERQRRIEATQMTDAQKQAALIERQRKTDEELMSKMETEAARIVDSSGKLAGLSQIGKSPEEIAQARQKMIQEMLFGPNGNKRYQSIYNRLYPGVTESFGSTKVLDYDPKTRSLIR